MELRHPASFQDFVPLPVDAGGRGPGTVRDPAGDHLDGEGSDRVQGRRRSRSIVNAARRFLADEDQMPRLTGRIFAGHLRSIVGSMTVEDLIRERQKLAEEILDHRSPRWPSSGWWSTRSRSKHRRSGLRLYQGPVPAARRRGQPDRRDCPVRSRSGGRGGASGERAQPGRLPPADFHRQGAVRSGSR